MATTQANSDSQFELQLSPWKGLPTPGPRHEGPMPRLDLGSDAPLPDIDSLPVIRPFEDEEEGGEAAAPGPGEIWLNGDVLMCVCPDCKAPISVRVWLMLAECWRCNTCVELSEQQQREARRLIQQREAAADPPEKPAGDRRAEIPPRAVAPPSARPAPRPTAPVPPPAPANAPVPPPLPTARGGATAPTAPTPAKTPPAGARPAGTRRLRKAQDEGGILTAFGDLFRSMPAWMVSLVVHILLLTLLALFTKERSTGDEAFILVSTTVSPEKKEGGEVHIAKPDEVKFDLPIPEKDVPKTEDQKRAMVLANQDARQLRLDPNVDAPNLPDITDVKRQIGLSDAPSRMVAARDPRVRVEMVKREGGTTLTEAAVSRSLRWLASVQNEDGSWSLEKHGGGLKSNAAATSLALLPFLGAGQTHQQGIYKDHVAKGLRWLVERQDKKTGDLRIDSTGNSGMYAHGQGAIVLSEAFAMTGDENLRVPAQKALDFIRDAQHAGGGWRYNPGEVGDTSVLGWQLMAMQSGKAAFLTVPDATLRLAGQYLDSAEYDDGAQYAYQPRGHRNQAMTAEGLLCRMYLGWTFTDRPQLQQGVDILLDKHMPRKDTPDVYYWYYGTQVLHHAGGESWDKWNNRMRDILVETQEKSGPNAGSWPILGPNAAPGGRIYVTSLCTTTLEIYYRHAPIFRQIKLE